MTAATFSATAPSGVDRDAATRVGLWVFMGVVSALFSLFIFAYVLRMNGDDATSIALPWQLGLSTALLAAGSLALWQAGALARRGASWARVRPAFDAGGLLALAFLATQGWAWAALLAAQVGLAGNPAGSLFYLLTAMHGLHVIGGLAAWALTRRSMRRAVLQTTPRIALCARYWHFLLAVWLVLLGTLRWVTPELARVICGPLT